MLGQQAVLRHEVRGWAHMEQAKAIWKNYALLDASAPAPAKNPWYASRPGRNASGLDPPPARGLRGTDVQAADHHNEGLRVKLAAVLQRHRHFGKVRDAEKLLV